MKRQEFRDFANALIAQCKATLEAKGEDYATEENAFNDFHAVCKNAELPNDQAGLVFITFLTKHWVPFCRALMGKELVTETHRGRAVDIINFVLLAEAWMTERDVQARVHPEDCPCVPCDQEKSEDREQEYNKWNK